MWEVFHRAQVCVIPSFREGLSIALLEAMALKTVAIASDVHGNNEVIENGESGLLFSPDKPEELAEKIIMVLKDDGLSNKLVKNAQERVTDYFSSDNMAKNYCKLYNKLVN